MSTTYFPLCFSLTFKKINSFEENYVISLSLACLQPVLRIISLVSYFPRNNATRLLVIMSSSSVSILWDSVYAPKKELSKY